MKGQMLVIAGGRAFQKQIKAMQIGPKGKTIKNTVRKLDCFNSRLNIETLIPHR